MSERQTPPVCNDHRWEPYPGPEPEYRTNRQMWFGERAYVICRSCHARTWLSREELAAARAPALGQADGDGGAQ